MEARNTRPDQTLKTSLLKTKHKDDKTPNHTLSEAWQKTHTLTKDSEGRTPLIIAVQERNIPAIEWLLDEKNILLSVY